MDEIRGAERTAIEAWVATLTRSRPPGSGQQQAEAVPTRSRNWKQRLHDRTRAAQPNGSE